MLESVLVWGTLFPFILEYCFHGGWVYTDIALFWRVVPANCPIKGVRGHLGLVLRALRSACVLLCQGDMPGRVSFLFDLHNPPSLSCLVPAKSKINYFKPWDVLKHSEHFFKGTRYLCFQKVVVKIYWWYLQTSLKCSVSEKLFFLKTLWTS